MRLRDRIRQLSKREDEGERLPAIKPAQCLGEACVYFAGSNCQSRLELLEASGKSGGVDRGPLVRDSSYSLYGHVCTGGAENIVVGLQVDSPNGQADAAELIARAGRLEGQRIILTPRT